VPFRQYGNTSSPSNFDIAAWLSGLDRLFDEENNKFRQPVYDQLLARFEKVITSSRREWRNAVEEACGTRLKDWGILCLLIQIDRLFPGESFSETQSKKLLSRIRAVTSVRERVGVPRATKPETLLSLVADDSLFPSRNLDRDAFAAALRETTE